MKVNKYTRFIHKFYIFLRKEKVKESNFTILKLLPKSLSYLLVSILRPLVKLFMVCKRRQRYIKSRNYIDFPKLIGFSYRYQIDPDSYFRHRLSEDWNRRDEYIYHDEIVEILHYMNGKLCAEEADVLRDKWSFWKRSSAVSLPTIPILGYFDKGEEVYFNSNIIERDLFSKISNRWRGDGAIAWKQIGDVYVSNDLSFDIDDMRDYLKNLSLKDPVVLQPRFSNHAELNDISGDTLSTARLVTFRTEVDDINLAMATFQMAMPGSPVDNFPAGGIASAVDIKTGTLGPGERKIAMANEMLAHHPETGGRIAGRKLPFWRDAIQLAFDAHREFGTVPSIGWDIALADHGPVLVEGNPVWGVELLQVAHRGPLSETIIPQLLVHHIQQASNSARNM